MGETNRKYLIWQLVIRVYSSLPTSTGERAQEGDIIGRRLPGSGVGLKEMTDLLWFDIDGFEDSDETDLTSFLFEPLPQPDIEPGVVFEKRRYCIPLDRLKIVAPFVDLSRVRDRADPYQPFLPIDTDDDDIRLQGLFLPNKRRPLQFQGLIYDKALGTFL